MKLEFTKEEFSSFLSFMQGENDIVRLVNPLSQQVYDASLQPCGEEEPCCSIWGRCERCENCTSLRALQTKARAYKIEILKHKTYWILSRFLQIEGTAYILEVVNDVTENLFMDSNQRNKIAAMIRNYNHLLVTDPMTGVYNRRFLDNHFLPSLRCCCDPSLVVNLAILDVDDFKHVNDVYGHQAGDLLLKDVAGFWHLHFHSREKNRERLTIRYGGDEFLIIACGMKPSQFQEEIRRDYRQMRKICYFSEEILIPFSITFGTASSEELGPGWTWDALFTLADRKMYANKLSKKQL